MPVKLDKIIISLCSLARSGNETAEIFIPFGSAQNRKLPHPLPGRGRSVLI
jgi:hypothetical protein